MSRRGLPALKTLKERVEWAASHGACDPCCEGRCRVCPRDVIEELWAKVNELEEKNRIRMAQQ